MAVVFLHVAAPPMYQFNSITRSWWWIADVVDSSVRWAVPIFLMLSGMLLLDTKRDESVKLFFTKRINKVFIPLLVWSILYSFWKLRYGLIFHGEFLYSIPGFIRDFLTGNVYYHLGFFYYLIGLYLITPILRVYVKNASDSSLKYFLILWLIASPLYSLMGKFFNLNIAIQLQFATGFVGYFVLGYFLSIADVDIKWRRFLYVLAGLGLMIAVFGTYVLTKKKDGVLDVYFYDYLTANIIVISASIFLFFRYAKWPKKLSENTSFLRRSIARFSNASFGVFLIHPMILDVLDVLKINASFIHPLVGIPITAILTILISLVLVKLLQRVPVLNRIVP